MCGLMGSIGFSDDIKLDINIINHRGPDSLGKWKSPVGEFPIEMKHARLSILDVSQAGNQPLQSKDNRYVFVYNGEIYNFIELREYLESKGHIFHSNTDTEVFMIGLINEGPNFQLRCNGMWSFLPLG